MLRTLSHELHQNAIKLREFRLLGQLALSNRLSPAASALSTDSIVALTSYPQRIKHAWRSIETILRQKDFHGLTVLVLSVDDFPRRDIPRPLMNQRRRGLEILWVNRDGRSFDKLLPVRREYPGQSVITVDDDLYYPDSMLGNLLQVATERPNSIVCARGWRVLPALRDGLVHYGEDWERSKSGDAGSGLHLPGGNGCLYPPESLEPAVDDLDLALKLAPTNDDIWFWIHAVRAGTEFACLGMNPHLSVSPQAKTAALSKVNGAIQESQFREVLRHFSVDPFDLVWRG